jgi:hypothetical protein
MKMTIKGLLGRVLMSLGAAIAGGVPPVVDITPTHLFNPAWPAHARLHEAWLLSTGGMLVLVALYFIWFYRDRPRFGIALAATLASVLLGGFFIASASVSLYGGILVDPLTAPMMPNNDMLLGLPANSVVFGFASLFLLVGTVLALNLKPTNEPA